VLEVLLFSGSPLLTVPLAAAVPAAVCSVAAIVPAWRRGWWSALGRVHYSAVALASAVFLAFAALYGLVWAPALSCPAHRRPPRPRPGRPSRRPAPGGPRRDRCHAPDPPFSAPMGEPGRRAPRRWERCRARRA